MITIADVALAPYALPFERPIVTARGTYRFRRGTLLRLTDDAGRLGYGDAAPWPGFASSDAEVEQGVLE